MKEYFLCYEFIASGQEVKLSVLRIHCKRARNDAFVLRIHCKRAGNDAFCIKNSLQTGKK